MEWLTQLWVHESVARTLLVLSLVISLGLILGSLRVAGISLGIAGVLFAGLLFGHFKIGLHSPVVDFVRDFGLVLFVYAIGMQVGPGFFSSFRRQGLSLNLLAVAIVFLGSVLALAVYFFSGIELARVIGLLSGATTNTPSLAAAQQALKDSAWAFLDAEQVSGMSYALAYPFGVIGIVLAMILFRRIFKIDLSREAEEYEQAQKSSLPPSPSNMDIVLKNPNLDGLPLKRMPGLANAGIIISRIYKQGSIKIAQGDTLLHLGDVIHAVGPREKLEELCLIAGEKSELDVRSLPSLLTTKRIVVTQSKVLGKTVRELQLGELYDVTITRVSRSGLEFTPSPAVRLQFGDTVLAVGEREAVETVASGLGNSPKKLNQPQLIPVFIGIALGVLIGSIPIHIAGVSAGIKLGLAGGPLLVAIILSRIGRVGPFVWYMPLSANLMMRETGIALFLACVGLRSGERLMEPLTTLQGLYWLGMGALITFFPLLVTGFIARMFLKVNYFTLCGLLAGSMTDPPALAFANSLASSESPAVAYATVYPTVMILRVIAAQMMVFMLSG